MFTDAEKETIDRLVDGGFARETVELAVLQGGDWTLLRHTGKVKIQIKPQGEG